MEKKVRCRGGFIYASTGCHVTCINLLTAMAGMSESVQIPNIKDAEKHEQSINAH